MQSPFSFKGELGRVSYFALSAAAFFTQHGLVYLIATSAGEAFAPSWWFWLVPQRTLVFGALALPEYALALGTCAILLVAWLLAALAFRRARRSHNAPVFAILAAIPALQILAILRLALGPEGRERQLEPNARPGAPGAHSIALGLFVGAGLSAAATAFSTLVLGTYGYALFLASPFVIGLVTAYIANRAEDVGMGHTVALVFGALMLGGAALLGFALEGLICLIMASPLIAGLGWLGAAIGRSFALACISRGAASLCVALLPLVMAAESTLPPRAAFESLESIDIAASPAVVWDAITDMRPIAEPPPLPFQLGLAYVIDSEIEGNGVGAIRRSSFSTGVAAERITEWEEERALAFIVESAPPSMRELTPYRRIHAPHVNGYFRTPAGRFSLAPLPNGGTRLTLTMRHELDLEPATYWLPIARWATHANQARVLKHIRCQASGAGCWRPGATASGD